MLQPLSGSAAAHGLTKLAAQHNPQPIAMESAPAPERMDSASFSQEALAMLQTEQAAGGT